MDQHVESKPSETKTRYDGLDGMRAYAAIGIVLMHVLANGAYGLDGFVFNRLIPSFSDLVFLFMVISGFSMCCGYYDKLIKGQIDLGKFYAKRFTKIWPFFAVMCLIDFLMSPGRETAFELLADLTLCFGLIPNASISVIGVGWFLGLVFVFYFMFPFICSLLSSKKRAWLAFAVAIVLSGLCALYFGAQRASFAYSGVFFMAGGMLYLYREPLRGFVNRFAWVVALLTLGAIVLYFLLGSMMPTQLIISVLLTLLAMGRQNVLLCNRATKWLSSISLEIYLCHMLVFRALEKLKLVHLFRQPWLNYATTVVVTFVGSVILSLAINKLLSLLGSLVKVRNGGNNYVR